MKRGNTALKRGVGLASAFALAIAGAVIAAPAANAAPATAASLRSTPSADAVYVQTDGSAGDYTGLSPYSGTVPTGLAYVLKPGVSGQQVNSLQVALPAGYSAGNLVIKLSTGASWAGQSVSLSRTAVTGASLDTAAGFSDAAKHASLGTPAGGALLPDGQITGVSVTAADTLTIGLKADSTTNTVGFYILSIDNIAVSLTAAAAGEVTATLDAATTVTDATGLTKLAGSASLGYVPTLAASASAETVEADGAEATNDVTLPNIVISENATGNLGSSVVLTISGGTVDTADPKPTVSVTGGATVTSVTPAATTVTVALGGTATSAGALTVSGIRLTGVAKNATVTVAVTTPASTGVATTTADAFNHTPALAAAAVDVETTTPDPRIAGANRYATAATIAGRGTWAGNAVVIANGETAKAGVDALSANYLAAEKHAPILLTTAKSLPSETQAALIKMFKAYANDINVYVMGKDDSVSQAVRDAVKFAIETTANLAAGKKVNIVEVAGDNRFQTSAASATEGGAAGLDLHSLTTSGAWLRTAFLASGLSNADALAAGSISAAAGIPVLLTNGTALDTKVSDAIKSLGIKQIIVLGGTDRVSDALVASLADLGVTSTKRIAGADRYETAAALATWAYATTSPTAPETNRGLGWDSAAHTVYVANGTAGFPDALAVGPLAGASTSPILTTPADKLPASAEKFLKDNKTKVSGIWALGQSDRISSGVIATAQGALK